MATYCDSVKTEKGEPAASASCCVLSEDFYRLPLLCHLSQGCSNKVMWGVIGAAVVITLITIPAVIYNSKLEPWPVNRFSFLSFQKAATDPTSKQTSFCVCAFPIYFFIFFALFKQRSCKCTKNGRPIFWSVGIVTCKLNK